MDPTPDFVLVFSTDPNYNSPVRGLSSDEDSRVRSKRADQLRDEYAKLVGVLEGAGLKVTGRNGAQRTNTVLLFVKADEQRVREEVTRER